MDRYVPALP